MVATTYNGITFSNGDVSFADLVTLYEPDRSGGAVPSLSNSDASKALGAPDGQFVSLGDGGQIRIELRDNVLVANGSSAPDLYVYEIGGDAENVSVFVSTDGRIFERVGASTTQTSGFDIDAVIANSAQNYTPDTVFRFVMIVDDGNQGSQSGVSVGADIDAIGATSTAGRIVGSGLADNVVGTAAGEVIDAGSGGDTVSGGAGNDTLNGEGGNDTIFGGAGRDVIDGGFGDDQLFGGRAPEGDLIFGGQGSDQIFSNAGSDTLYGDGINVIGGGNDVIGTGAGSDRADGGDGNDTLFGGGDAGSDRLNGNNGNDVAYGGRGTDILDGGDGDDEMGGGAGVDTVIGGSGNDTLFGGADADRIVGGTGGDLIYGGTGDDNIFLAGPTIGTASARDGNTDIVGAIANNGNDVVVGFEVGIDDVLLRETGLTSFAQVDAALSNNAQGDAVLTISAGNTIRFVGVSEDQLTAADFVF